MYKNISTYYYVLKKRKVYEKEKITLERNEILRQLEEEGLTQEQKYELEKRLNDIIIQLVKMK